MYNISDIKRVFLFVENIERTRPDYFEIDKKDMDSIIFTFSHSSKVRISLAGCKKNKVKFKVTEQ